jgi:hypothetical protein
MMLRHHACPDAVLVTVMARTNRMHVIMVPGSVPQLASSELQGGRRTCML